MRDRYIGIASTVLRSGLDGYSYQLNDPVGANIKELLKNGAEVKIFGVKRPERTKLELEKEESMLIKQFDPDWNVRSELSYPDRSSDSSRPESERSPEFPRSSTPAMRHTKGLCVSWSQ